MLCNSKTPRPDRLLQNRLIALAYSLIALTAAIISFLIYPQYFIYTVVIMLLATVFCLSLGIKTLSAAEEAISYGGFAGEFINDDTSIKRIDNAHHQPILQNSQAAEFLKDEPVLEFIEKNLSDRRHNKNAFQRLSDASQNLSFEEVELSLFSENNWYGVSVRPIFLKKADIFQKPFSVKKIQKETYLFWNIKDITAQKNMDQIMTEERKSLHDFLDYLPVGLFIKNSDHNLEYVNHAFAQIIGLNREEAVKRSLKDLLADNRLLENKSESFEDNVVFLEEGQPPRECFVSLENFRENQKIKQRGVVVKNIPTDESLKQSLNASLDKISWLFKFAPVGIIFTDVHGIIKECNPAAQDFFKLAKENILNKNLADYISKEDRAELKKRLQNICSEAGDISRALDVKIKDDKEERTALLYISPMRQNHTVEACEAQGLIVYMIDATKQKNLEQQFAQAQKMQAMGQLAGGVAHDFNNLLTAMIGFCDLLLQRHGVGDPSFADLIQIKQNANRAAGLVKQLLAFSRKQPLKPKLIDVTENFTELSHMLKRILGEQIILKFHHGNDLGFIRVDPIQFSQVIINLAVNAKDAMNGSGTLSISTRVEALSKPHRFGEDIIKPGEFVVIDVKDNGVGISEENLSRIFEPFFSTKQNVAGSGTGLGLSMVYGIVRQTEGFIKVESVEKVGTTFSIYLPRLEAGQEAPAFNEPAAKPGINADKKPILGLNVSSIDRSFKTVASSRILLVEDEDSVRTFALRALQKKGYEVVGCNSAENALQHLETDKDFHLLITDMVMPGINGAELAKIVRKQIKNIKIILASGYSEEIARKEVPSAKDFEFLAKPFSLGDLTEKVLEILRK